MKLGEFIACADFDAVFYVNDLHNVFIFSPKRWFGGERYCLYQQLQEMPVVRISYSHDGFCVLLDTPEDYQGFSKSYSWVDVYGDVYLNERGI